MWEIPLRAEPGPNPASSVTPLAPFPHHLRSPTRERAGYITAHSGNPSRHALREPPSRRRRLLERSSIPLGKYF